ncbi:hypothetical protein ILUMI_25074, partial [Ignelater luminosus]
RWNRSFKSQNTCLIPFKLTGIEDVTTSDEANRNELFCCGMERPRIGGDELLQAVLDVLSFN